MIGNFKKKKSRKWYWRSMTWVDEDPENPQSNKGLKCPGICQKNYFKFLLENEGFFQNLAKKLMTFHIFCPKIDAFSKNY